MEGIYGWLGSSAGRGESASEALAGMRGDGAPGATHLRPAGAFATAPGITPADVRTIGPLTVAVAGRLQWRAQELAAMARQKGANAAIAEAYARDGCDCLRQIGGSFALAILDSRDASGLVAVDRMGIRTLSYATPPGGLVFAPNADTVVRHPAVKAELSDQGLFNYLYFHAVPSPGTIYRSVAKLQPGECLIFENGKIERRFYWQMQYTEKSDEPLSALKIRFRNELRKAADRALGDDLELGAFLSGGTDSSTVAGLLTELRHKPARTYSIGFAEEGFDEMHYARITARHFRTDAHEYYVQPADVVETIPLVASVYDEPFGNASAVPTYLCARMARGEGVRVMLAGDGGDEIFGGNARYAWQKLFEPYGAIPEGLRRKLIEPLVFGLPGGEKLAAWRKLRSYIEQARIPLPARLESYNFLYRSPLAEIFEPDFLARIDPDAPLVLQQETFERTESREPVDRMMHLDLKFTLADNDLRKVTRMCEAAGVEVRFPLLDDALVEFSGELPASLKVKRMKLRHFFKEALKDFLPPETIAKEKHGFGLPFGLWLRSHAPLAEMAHESLAAFQRRGIVRPAYVQRLLEEHRQTHASYFGVMIWVIMMLERWLVARNL